MLGAELFAQVRHHCLCCETMSPIFSGRGIVLDIEGTVSPYAYVHEVLFPYARRALGLFLRQHWNRPDVAAAQEQVARDLGHPSFREWCAREGRPPEFWLADLKAELLRQMDQDAKTTGLKEFQGLIWRDGFTSGELKSQIFPDVPRALERWSAKGKTLAVYSSGSITAQKLFFGHSDHGDLTPFFRHYFDTTTGPKRVADSYRAIARDMDLPAETLLFVSDVVEELDAARTAGFRTLLALRPGNPPVSRLHDHPSIENFSQLKVA